MHNTGYVAIGTGNSKNEEEGIVLFKKSRLYLMVVFVKVP
jgi:hypothetical protein